MDPLSIASFVIAAVQAVGHAVAAIKKEIERRKTSKLQAQLALSMVDSIVEDTGSEEITEVEVKKAKKMYHCSKCHQSGHNRATCQVD